MLTDMLPTRAAFELLLKRMNWVPSPTRLLTFSFTPLPLRAQKPLSWQKHTPLEVSPDSPTIAKLLQPLEKSRRQWKKFWERKLVKKWSYAWNPLRHHWVMTPNHISKLSGKRELEILKRRMYKLQKLPVSVMMKRHLFGLAFDDLVRQIRHVKTFSQGCIASRMR